MILIHVLCFSTNLYKVVADGVKIGNLVRHVSSHHQDIQENAIGLINSILLKAPPEQAKVSLLCGDDVARCLSLHEV